MGAGGQTGSFPTLKVSKSLGAKTIEYHIHQKIVPPVPDFPTFVDLGQTRDLR